MNAAQNLCMSCMKDIGEEKKCPYCGYHIDTIQSPPFLPVKTVIANRYLVGKMTEYNSEGATYIGWDLTEKKAVSIREFMPDSFTKRTVLNLNLQVMLGSEGTFAELRKSFEELWTKLRRLSGLSALINVTDLVEDYGTSYAIFDHLDGISLRDFLLRSKTGYIPWDRARSLLMPILSTIASLHSAGIIHRGISPTTLIIAGDGKLKITGFCIAEERLSGSFLTPQIFDGYAPVEQYGLDSNQGAWTDIYAFGAVLYRTLIGSDPIPSKERMTNDRLMVPGRFAEALPAYVINGLINALQILPQDRTRTIEQLRAELSASPVATAAGAEYSRKKQIEQKTPVQSKPHTAPPKKKKSGIATIAVTALIISLLGITVFGVLAMTVFKDKINLNVGKAPETTTIAAEKVTVPNFVEKSYYEVSGNQIFTTNFNLQFEEVFNEEIASGYIISQSIQPDVSVEKGTTIILYVSKGVETVVLPNVVGSNVDEAVAQLEELHFVVEIVTTNEGYYADGEVLSQVPIADKTYDIGSKVILKVYDEPEEESSEEEFGW